MKVLNNFLSGLNTIQKTSVIFGAFFFITGTLFGADVVQRNTVATSRPVPSRAGGSNTSRMPSMSAATPIVAKITETTTEPVIETAPEPVAETSPEVVEKVAENKSSKFESILEKTNNGQKDTGADARAQMIQNQRAALDSAGILGGNIGTSVDSPDLGLNACDTGLRTCMKKICANDFSKCSGDSDTLWGDKMDTCRRDLKCSGREFQIFANEIKADRDENSNLSGFSETIDCGNNYNDCIISKCGQTMNKCVGKSAGDAAIASCTSIAKKCQMADSGLQSRTMGAFGTLRDMAGVQLAADEKRLYEIRDKMERQCKTLGAMFDARTFDCVYTVNFWASDKDVPYSSQKAYAGNSFDCNQNWFGIDITTFKENAYRLTRAQKSASSTMLGSGLGIAAGAISSGAIGRALDTAKAKGAVKDAKEEAAKEPELELKENGTQNTSKTMEEQQAKQAAAAKARNDNIDISPANNSDKHKMATAIATANEIDRLFCGDASAQCAELKYKTKLADKIKSAEKTEPVATK